jgi:hypothetical protein
MILRTAFIVATAILFLSGPAQGDPLKFKSHGAFSENFHFNNNSNNGHSNVKFLGGFKPQSGKNEGFFKFHEDHFVLVVPHDFDNSNDGPKDPVTTPEPGVLTLLLAGVLGLGVFAYRRNVSAVAAQ